VAFDLCGENGQFFSVFVSEWYDYWDSLLELIFLIFLILVLLTIQYADL